MPPPTRRSLRILNVLGTFQPDRNGAVESATRALAARGHELHVAVRAPQDEDEDTREVEVHRWPMSVGRAGELPLLLALQLRLRADVIHFRPRRSLGPLTLPTRLLSWPLHNPVLVATPSVDARVRPFGARALDAIAVATADRATRLVRAGLPPERVHVVHNGIDPVARRQPGDQRAVIFALGQIVMRKGFDVLLHAFDNAASSRPDWQLVVAGEGRELVRLRKLAGRLRHGDRIFLPGHVSGEQKERLFREASIGVVPSRKDDLPAAMLELQAHGIAVVASDVGAIGEVAATGEAARLVPPDDPGALARALGELMDRPDDRRRLEEGALASSRERTWQRVAERLEALYASLLSVEAGVPDAEPEALPRSETP